jgi:hypothetical protein
MTPIIEQLVPSYESNVEISNNFTIEGDSALPATLHTPRQILGTDSPAFKYLFPNQILLATHTAFLIGVVLVNQYQIGTFAYEAANQFSGTTWQSTRRFLKSAAPW